MGLFSTYESVFPYEYNEDKISLDIPISSYVPELILNNKQDNLNIPETVKLFEGLNGTVPISSVLDTPKTKNTLKSPNIQITDKVLNFNGKQTLLSDTLNTLRLNSKNPQKHFCTRYVAKALTGDTNVKTASGIKNPQALSQQLEKSGWTNVYDSNYVPQAGDVYTFWKKGSNSNKDIHSSMFDGKKWISYLAESEKAPWYLNRQNEKGAVVKIYRLLKSGGKINKYVTGDKFTNYSSVYVNDTIPNYNIFNRPEYFNLTKQPKLIQTNLFNSSLIPMLFATNILPQQITNKQPIDNTSVEEYMFNRLILDDIENNKRNPRGGYNIKLQLWTPHQSVEGGAPTIAYGIKLDSDKGIKGEILEKIKKNGGITDDEAKDYLKRLLPEYINNAKKTYNEKYNWDTLTPWALSFLADYQFNVNGGLAKFPNLMKAFSEGNINEIKNQYHRKGVDKRNEQMMKEIKNIISGKYKILK